jgi:hypothetical protein
VAPHGALHLHLPLSALSTAALIGVCAIGLLNVEPLDAATAQVVRPPDLAHADLAHADLAQSSFVQRWSAGPLTQDKGSPIAESSPMVADLDGEGPAVLVGDRAGYLYAYHLSDGSAVAGWPVFDGGAPIDSTPSVAALGGNGLSSVFVGSGNAQHPDLGGYQAYGPGGQELWHTNVSDLASDKHPAYGVQASLTVADLQGSTDVFAGSLDQLSYALDASSGSVLAGWPYFSADSVFSTAAAGDLYGTGQDELVVGGASTAGLAMGQSYSNGGHVRVLTAQGALIYDYDSTQEIDSSPAIGGFLAGGETGIVVGTGSYYAGASDTDSVKAFTTRLGLVWSDTLDGLTSSSPALADVQGDGQLDVVEGTDTSTSGAVWVLNGTNGATVWHVPVVGRVIGSVVAADLTGAGYQDILVPTTHGVEVLDGQSGAEVTVLGPSLGFQGSPLVTDDPNGTAGITIAGYNGNNEGVVQHYEIPGSDGALAVGTGAWPMFHHDPALSGTSSVLPDLGTVTPTDLAAQSGDAQVSLSWGSPVGSGGAEATGYNVYESTAPGHEQGGPLNGATPVTSTDYAVTGLTNGTKYYFEVTAVNSAGEGAPSDEASATPAAPPSAPAAGSPTAGDSQVSLSWGVPSSNGGAAITSYNVYISTTPGSQGTKIATVPGTSYTATGLTDGTTYYFEVTAVNSAGESPASVQVSAAPMASGPIAPATPPVGYRLATVDGQVFAFGKVTSYPSARPGSPVVGVATTPDGLGYWLATKDGDVLNAGDAQLYGSMAGKHLSSPVVGIAATPGGHGYWLVAADGGIFAFGDAHFHGSTGSRRLNKPIVGIAATPDGNGYWMVASDGGIFAFGDAHFHGSTGSRRLNKPIVGIAATPDGNGYWMVASDGGIFAFGDAHFYGSTGSRRLNKPIVGIAATPDGNGYWMVASDGGIFAFGDAAFFGSLGGRAHREKVAGIAR